MLVALAGLVGMVPAGASATTLIHTPLGAPLCLSTSASACNGGTASQTQYFYTFDLSALVGADEIITAASLSLDLFDDFGQADGSDKLYLFLDGVDMEVNGDTQNDLLLALTDLSPLSDESLTVWVRARTGDFFYGGVTLTFTVEDRPADPGPDEIPAPVATSVPLPTSLALLGLGLAALAVRRRA
jgi:hypothetical protein